MTNLRLIVPAALVAQVLALLRELASVTNVVHVPGAGIEPEGDLITADVAREDVSLVVERLCTLGLDRNGGIALEAVDASVSRGARRAMREAEGYASDAVLWEQVEQTVSESSDLSFTFLAFMAIATCLAAIGILVDSAILIVGAMVVGPEYGAMISVALGIDKRDTVPIRRGLSALLFGLALAILVTLVFSVVIRALDLQPRAFDAGIRPVSDLISTPNAYSVIVAVLAGIVGVVSLTEARASTLIGVFISVTRSPPRPTWDSPWRSRNGARPGEPSCSCW